MPHHGPWQTADVRTAIVDYPVDFFTGPGTMQSFDGNMHGGHVAGESPDTFADACEAAVDSGTLGQSFAGSWVYALAGTIDHYEIHQYFVQVKWAKVYAAMVNIYAGTLPARATVEYEQLDGTAGTSPPRDLSQMRDGTLSVDITGNPETLFAGVDGAEEFYLPAAATVQATDATSDRWLPGATLAGRSVLGSAALTASYDQALTVDVTVPGARWAVNGTDIAVRYALDTQISHAHMTPGVGPPDLGQGWGPYFAAPSRVGLTVAYQPPRYRFVYDVLPPLRQYPRDDFLGGAPRQGRTAGSTSVQASTRQGWKGTYR